MNEIIFYVSPAGCDENAGTREAPFKTIARAQDEARRADTPVTVEVLAGTYKEALVFDDRDSGDTYLTRENAVLTGGLTATAAGIAAAMLFGLLAAVCSKSGDKT